MVRNPFKKLISKAQAAVSELGAEIDNESDMHQAVLQLLNNVIETRSVNQGRLPIQVEKAADNFIKALNEILEKDRENQGSRIAISQFALANATIAIIHKYQPKLEAAPGFWNQLKAHINNFIERVTGIKDALKTEKTEFSNNDKFGGYKQKVRDLKQKLESPDEQLNKSITKGKAKREDKPEIAAVKRKYTTKDPESGSTPSPHP